MATSLHEPPVVGEERVRILPPEHRGVPSAAAPRRPVAWIAAFVIAVAALVAVVVVEEIRISDRDDAIAALEQDQAALQTRVEGQQAVVRDLKIQLSAALEEGTASDARIEELRAVIATAERGLARMEARQAMLQTRAETFGAQAQQLRIALANWVPPVADGTYGGRMLGVNATADPPRIVFEPVEAENAQGWMLMPVATDAPVTVWSYPPEAATQRTEDLAFLDQMFAGSSPWARSHRNAWYRVVVLDGTVTEIHQAAPEA